MADLDKIVDELSELSVIEAADLVKKLEDNWDVSAAAPAAAVAVAAPGGGEAAEEQDSFDVILVGDGGKKIGGKGHPAIPQAADHLEPQRGRRIREETIHIVLLPAGEVRRHAAQRQRLKKER